MWFRRRRLDVRRFDAETQRWQRGGNEVDRAHCDQLDVTTYNIWFNEQHAEQRYRAISDLLQPNPPDVMVFQEVTDVALTVFLAQPWIREHYRSVVVTGRGNYGMLLLTRVPVVGATYTRLPTRLARGFLRAELNLADAQLMVCSLHLESGKASAGLRARQLAKVFRALRKESDVVVLGDFNMRDNENGLIDDAYVDIWPALRPDEPGYTEDTTINLMRYDMKDKHRHVRFDRVLLRSRLWTAVEIDLLGTDPIRPDLPRVFPSDHFGVRCKLTLR